MNKGYYSSTDSHILSEPQSPAVNLNYSKTVQVCDRVINFDSLPYPPTIYSMARAWVFNNPSTNLKSCTHSTIIPQDLSPNSSDTEKTEEKKQNQDYHQNNSNNQIQNTVPQSLCDSSKSYINSMEDIPVELLLKSHVMKAKAQKQNYEEQLSKEISMKYRNRELYKRLRIIQKQQKQMMENQLLQAQQNQ